MSRKIDLLLFIIFYILLGPIGFLCYLIIRTTVSGYMCYRNRGAVTPACIIRSNDSTGFPFSDIATIKADFGEGFFPCNTLNLHLSILDTTKRACLTDYEVVKLAQTRLNRWTVNGDSLTIGPGDTVNPSVFYAASGKYNIGERKYGPFMLLTILLLFFSKVFVLFDNLYFFMGLLVVVSIFFGLERYKKVSAILSDNCILLKDENGQEHFMALGDVKNVEKDFFRAKVTGRDNRVLFFPRSFYLLPELLEYYAGVTVVRRKRFWIV